MELLRAYAYFSAQTELTAIGETGAGIGIDTGGIDIVKKARRC
jgi:hypothetical protein